MWSSLPTESDIEASTVRSWNDVSLKIKASYLKGDITDLVLSLHYSKVVRHLYKATWLLVKTLGGGEEGWGVWKKIRSEDSLVVLLLVVAYQQISVDIMLRIMADVLETLYSFSCILKYSGLSTCWRSLMVGFRAKNNNNKQELSRKSKATCTKLHVWNCPSSRFKSWKFQDVSSLELS